MSGSDLNYTIVYRGDVVENISDGAWLIIQRAKEYGGGFWLGLAYKDMFWLELDRPMSLNDCLQYLVRHESTGDPGQAFEEEFTLK